MRIDFNKIFKIFLTNFFILFSFYFFYQGYLKIFDYKNNENKIDQKSILTLKKVDERNNTKIKEEDTYAIMEKKVKNKFENNEENINYEEILIKVKKNQTFSNIISPYVKDNQEKQNIINKINSEFKLRNLQVNQKIFLYLNKNKRIEKIVIPIKFNLDLILDITDENSYSLKKEKLLIKNQFNSKKVIINTSFYQDGRKAEIPLTILSDAISLLSFDIDFQRDIQEGNGLEIYYESYYNEERRTISYGKIHYLKLKFQKNSIEYFLFTHDDNSFDYYNREGKNAKKALMKTPIDGARLSSSYGMRKHPISGYNKLHKGVDFAAPKGTPIYAAGNGVIEYIGRKGNYGKYIRIRHNNSYKTAYAHLNSYKKGMSKGVRVIQGQIIGFVGSTGRSTGPHLHYEVIYQNKHINPMKMKLPSSKKLNKEELIKFKKQVNKTYSDFLFNLYE